MKIKHVSRNPKIKRFNTRVPKYRVANENAVIRRICGSDKVENCIASFPYRSDLVVSTRVTGKSSYLCVYEFDVEEKDILSPEEVFKAGVPDAIAHSEYWILKNITPSSRKIINISKFRLSRYNSYTWEYYGDVTELEYEQSKEPYSREMMDTIYEERNFNKLKKIAKKLDIEILDVECREGYFGYGYPGDDDYYPNYKNISKSMKKIYKVKYKIPANVDAFRLWELIMENDHKYNKRTLNFIPLKFLNMF